jgi:hypothetical protein
MKHSRRFSIVLALTILASASYAGSETGNDSSPGPAPTTPESRRSPKDSCLKPCTVIRISNRCECSFRQTLPTATVA